jgi:hypothetical protein
VTMYGTSCAPPPISVTCSKWYIRKPPFVLGAQPLDMICCVAASLLNKFASWKLWCPLSLCLSHPARAALGRWRQEDQEFLLGLPGIHTKTLSQKQNKTKEKWKSSLSRNSYIIGRIVPPPKGYIWSLNFQYLRMWPYLGISSLQW